MSDLMQAIQFFLKSGWDFFLLPYPGTNFKFSDVLIGFILIDILIRFIRAFYSANNGGTSASGFRREKNPDKHDIRKGW